eukprot:gene29430-36654_t
MAGYSDRVIFEDSTQAMHDEAEDEEQSRAAEEVFLGHIAVQIVGCQYYPGVAHAGEYVNLVREAQNPYDRNAVRVDNT